MADVIKLAIIFETQDALARIKALEAQLAKVDGASKSAGAGARGAGLAFVRLGQEMASGNVSALGLVRSMTHVADFLVGPWGLAIGTAIAALVLFANHARQRKEDFAALGEKIREANEHIQDLLHPAAALPFQSDIETLTTQIAELQLAIDKADHSWLQMFRHLLAPLYDVAHLPIPSADPVAERALREAQRRRQMLTPEAARQRDTETFARRDREARSLSLLSDQGEIARLNELLSNMRKNMQDLIHDGLEPGSDEAKGAAMAIKAVGDQLQHLTRLADVMKTGLQDVAEELGKVLVGLSNFEDFLNKLLLDLFTKISGNYIDDFLNHLHLGPRGPGTPPGGGTVDVGPVQFMDASIQAPPSVTTQVSFNVSAIDAQDTARFFDQNSAQIAGHIAKQASRSQALRRTLRG